MGRCRRPSLKLVCEAYGFREHREIVPEPFRRWAPELDLCTSARGLVSRTSPVQTAVRNCTRDEGRSFEAGSQVQASNRCKLLSSKAMVVSVAVNVGTISRRVRLRVRKR